ncbi:MAG TPA: two-component regulator propeller domain-containing protein [Parafilimonas sp.]|nr:two-component regulator propeller domain-containing protein [Parafilimonas sp.]
MRYKLKRHKIFRARSLFRFSIISLTLIVSSCSENKKRQVSEGATNDTISYPQITVLASLPDSNKPVTISLASMPKPFVTQQLSPAPVHEYVDSITGSPIPADAQGRGFFTNYTTDNGLALDQVYCGYKDSIGNLWFGTSGGGVSKYDGKDFTNYTTAQGLANSIVWTIVEDNAGNLWFGTDGSGVSKYDGRTFTNYGKAQGLVDDVVLTIIKDKAGNLWFGTLGGISKYDGRVFTNYTTADGLPNNEVRGIVQDRKGDLWFGTSGGISEYDGHRFRNYQRVQGLPSDSIRTLIEDRMGNLWFGTAAGVSKFDGKKFTGYPMAGGLANALVNSIAQDRSGNLWFGTDGYGAVKLDSNNVFTSYGIRQGLPNNAVTSVTEDATGDLWFSTFGGGISKYGGKSFTSFTTAQGLNRSVVYSITEDQSRNLWFGTYRGGADKYDGKSITNYTTAQGLPSNDIYAVEKDRMGNLWFGTAANGVCKYDGKTFTTYTTSQGLADDRVFGILDDKQGNMWFATLKGISEFHDETFTNYSTRQGLANDQVFTIFEDSEGNIWFGTSGGGVTEYNGSTFTNYTTGQGLANDVVWTIDEDKDGNLWFGTQDGLSLLRKETLATFSESIKQKRPFTGNLFETITSKDGLPDNFITQILQSNDQKLYAGTNLGVCELVPSSDGDKKQKWTVGKTFNSLTGYPVKDVNGGTRAMFIDSKGIIWIGTGSDKTGLVRFDPKSVSNSASKFPALVIERIRLNNASICWNDVKPVAADMPDSNATPAAAIEEISLFGRRLTTTEKDSIKDQLAGVSFDGITKWYPIPEKLVLPHRFNNISFDFNTIETARNFRVKYQYMLDGYNKEWSVPDDKTSAVFGNIYEGHYTFKVRAQNAAGTWSEPLTYSFRVLPPWWRTWWMYAVYAIVIIGMVRLYFWWNTRRIIYRNKVLEHKITIATSQLREEKETVEEQNKKIESTLAELRATQAQLIQSEKMASLGELTAGIAHEIQNPLNFVNNFAEVNKDLIEELKAEFVKERLQPGQQLQDEILNDIAGNEEKILHHGKRAEAIVKGMLQHSRTSTGVKEPTDINALCDEYLRLCYHGLRAKDKAFNASYSTDFDDTIGKIKIVPQDIGRVILNLLSNAFYAVHEKRKSGAEKFNPTVVIRTKKEGDKVLIITEDNGGGIPQKLVDKIFQPFFTTKPTGEGTGLGLSLSYDIIKAHGGEIKVATKEGESTIFTIELPVE